VFGDVRARFDRSDLRAGLSPARCSSRTFWRESDQAVWPAPSRTASSSTCIRQTDSYVFGQSVNEVRTELGRLLAREQPADADVVVPVPDSGAARPVGFSAASSIPLRMDSSAITTSGAPSSSRDSHPALWRAREAQSREEYSRGPAAWSSSTDSIVRGTTMPEDLKIVRAAGAREWTCVSAARRRFAVLLRRRHAAAIRAHRRYAHTRGDLQVHRSGQAGVSEPRRDALGGSATARPTAPRATTGHYPVAFHETKPAICSSP